jgi:hypothetical protein
LGALFRGAVHGSDPSPGRAALAQLGHYGQLERLGGLAQPPGGGQ